MLRHASPRRYTGLAALALTGFCAGSAAAQEVGRSLVIGTTLGFEANDNLALDPDSDGSTISGRAGLDFALQLATPVQSLGLSGGFDLRASSGPEEQSDEVASDGLGDVDIRLDYDRQARDARFGVTGVLSRQEVARIEPFDSTGLIDGVDGIDGLDDPLLLDDLDDLGTRREGTRLRFGIDTELELRRSARFGVTLSAGYSGLRFSDTNANELTNGNELTDEDRYRAGLGLRFDLDRATQVLADFDYGSYEDDGDDEGRRDTYDLSVDLGRTTATGSVGLVTSAVSTEDGERFGLEFRRSLDLPLWNLSGQFGATRTENGDILPTGSLSAVRDLPLGAISLDLSREVRSGSDDEERRVSGITFDYSRPLNSLTSMGLGVSYIRSEPTGAGATESFGRASIRMNRTLTEDWSLNVSLAHRIEDNGVQDQAHDNSVSFNLRRQVTFRP